jgi:hypothetical protein
MQAPIHGLRNTHRVLAVIVLVAWSLGCRSDPYRDAYLEMLNAEKRVLEDRLYEAEYNYEQSLAELKAAHGSSKEVRKPSGRTRPGETERPLTEPEDDEPHEAPELPTIELPPGVEEGKRKRATPTARRPGAPAITASAVGPAKSRPLSDNELAAAIVSALDQRVETIHVNPRLTRGADFDGEIGDDGITVLIEPRNRSGGFVPEAGRISIVLLDPSKTGEAARIARWDLDADAAGEFLQTDSLDRGLLLHLPWQGTIPDRKRLHLFVRYLTADGRKLETDRQIEIESMDMVANRWTAKRAPLAENAPGREITVSWVPQDEPAKPTIAQAAAEEPVQPEKAAAVADASQPVVLQAEPAKTLNSEGPGRDKADAARNVPSSPQVPPGRFWKPDR